MDRLIPYDLGRSQLHATRRLPNRGSVRASLIQMQRHNRELTGLLGAWRGASLPLERLTSQKIIPFWAGFFRHDEEKRWYSLWIDS